MGAEMTTGFKSASIEKRRLDWIVSLGLGLLAAVVYGLTLSKGVFPGESAHLMTVYSGIETLELPLHPLWGGIVSWLSGLPVLTLPLRLNLFSLVCSCVSVVLMYRIMSFLIHDTISEEYSVEYAPRVSVWAGVVSALAFQFAVPVWQAATHLQYQGFDLMLALIAAYLLVLYAAHRWTWALVAFSLLYGAGIVESVIFVPLSPVMLTFLIYVLWKNGQLSLPRVAWMGVLAALGMGLYYVFSWQFFKSSDSSVLGFKSVMDVMVSVWKSQVLQLRSGLPRVGWLILLMMSVVPWVAGGFASFRALNNERSWSQYILHFTLSVITVLGLTNAPISPWEILKPYGRLPVCSYAMLAMVAGYLVAYWYLLLKVKRPKRGNETSALTKQAGDWLGLLLAYPMAGIVALAAIINVFECGGSRGAFADRCAQEILDRMGSRTWLVTDGTLDPHLQLLARERGLELNLLCLQKDMSPYYLKHMASLIERKGLFAAGDLQRMKSTLDLGVLPFIQDWFAMDKEIEKKVAVFGVPDFWYTAGITPVPEFMFFAGCRDIRTLKDKPLLAEYQKFWDEMGKVLPKNEKATQDPTLTLRANMRRHVGFVANNLGVLLEDLENDKDAYAVYTFVHSKWDPENISSLFNRFEMARRGVAAASASKELIERELKDFVGNLKQRYPLWSLSRFFGYVRSPELFARLGWGWALSGQQGAALAGINRAINLLPTDQRVNAMQTMAAIYALSDDRSKTEAVYQDIMKSDPGNRTAMLGLARLAVQEGAMEKAKAWLEKAAKSEDKRGVLGVEWAVIHLMNNDVGKARLALQEATDLQPKNLQAWAMLAMVQLQQDEAEDVEKVLLPKMESVAGTVDDYFIQITRAQVAMKKGKNFQRAAREGFIRASMLRPDVPGVKDMILQLDIAMNDQEGAELHARQVLRVNRKHSLANYVMGSLRLQEGSYGEAEDFLRRSVDTNPSAAALNDLAEVLRRIRKFEEAERFSRMAVEKSPDLYVAWETLGATLLDLNKNLDEAERVVKKAMELYGDDLRIRITLARILLKKGEIERARELIRQVKNRQGELTKFDQAELAKLAEEASSGRSR
jgi:tetratricopeptide (TPR) repeat protein